MTRRQIITMGMAVTVLILILAVAASRNAERVEPAPQLPHDVLVPMPVQVPASTRHWQGEMAGEVTQDSAILQARLTVDGKVRSGDVQGQAGIGAFVLLGRLGQGLRLSTGPLPRIALLCRGPASPGAMGGRGPK